MAIILVVEDEEQIRVLVESILVDDGHQTLSAGTTSQALAVIQTDLLFAVAGPVEGDRCSFTNCSWTIDRREMR